MFADQRAATVSLAGVHTAMSVPGTEHAGQDRLDKQGSGDRSYCDMGHLGGGGVQPGTLAVGHQGQGGGPEAVAVDTVVC